MDSKPKSIPSGLNCLLCVIFTAIILLELFIVPSLASQYSYATAFLILLLIPINLPLWALIHEAIHKNLCFGRRVNEVLGRILCVLFGIPFSILRFGHLMHHQFNREWESEIFDETYNPITATIMHYSKMLGGLYFSEVAATYILALLPADTSKKLLALIFSDSRHVESATRVLLKPDNLLCIRQDCLAISLLYTAAFLTYGAHWPLVLVIICGRAFIISLMDNAYHYGTPADNSVPAKELEAPPYLRLFLLNFNHHLTHHKNPTLPWIRLAHAHAHDGRPYSQTLKTAILEQFRGPIRPQNPA